MSRKRTAIYPESFVTLKVTDLYRFGVLGPKPDRLRLSSKPSGTLIQRMDLGGQSLELRAKLADGKLHVACALLQKDASIVLSEIHIVSGRHRVAALCPCCETPVFHLYLPLVELRPDGLGLSRELLCRHCHRISRPSWRYSGAQKIERAALHRRTMAEKLGLNPTIRGMGVATLRHDKWFARMLRADRAVLGVF